MGIVDFNKKIVIQRHQISIDNYGNHKEEWKDYYHCFATITGESGNEKSIAGLTTNNYDALCVTRWCRRIADVDALSYRIKVDNVFFNIISVDHCGYKRNCLKFSCKKVNYD